jgi:hypothetical protein
MNHHKEEREGLSSFHTTLREALRYFSVYSP